MFQYNALQTIIQLQSLLSIYKLPDLHTLYYSSVENAMKVNVRSYLRCDALDRGGESRSLYHEVGNNKHYGY